MISRALKLAALAAAAIYLLLWAGWNGADWPVAYWPGRFLHLPTAGWLALALLGGVAMAVAVQSVSDTISQLRHGRLVRDTRKFAKARQDITNALRTAQEGGVQAALRSLRRKSEGPLGGEAMIAIARIQMDQGLLEEAGQSLDSARAMGRPSAGLSIRLARQFKRKRDWDGAESYLNRAREVRPDDPEIERLYIELDAARRDWEAAVRHQRARMERLGDNAAPIEQERLAWLLWEQGTALAETRQPERVEEIARELGFRLKYPRLAEDILTKARPEYSEKRPLTYACLRCQERFPAWRAVCPSCHSPDSLYHRDVSNSVPSAVPPTRLPTENEA